MTFPYGRRARSTSPPDAPGSAVKTRTVTRYRWITHTVDGETEMVREPYDVEVPVPPRDWDRAVLTAVTAVAAVLLAACVLWSTVNVGGLLTRVAIAPAAYGAAVAFDLAWIVFMAVEWLARYDPARAELPRQAGHVALLVAMVAVGAHGWLSGQKAIGIISAVVSGIVKTVWTVVLRHHSKPLDPLTQQWVDKRRAAAGGKLAMIPIRRELLRAEAQVEAERIAIDLPAGTGEPDGQAQLVTGRLHHQSGSDGTPVADPQALIGQMHGPIVYFLSNGNRVKIGTSRNLASRISTLCLRPEDLLFALHGGHGVEAALHQRFTEQRVGNSEWFEIAGPLAEYIAEQTGQLLPASPDAPEPQQDASGDAPDAPQVAEIPRITPGITKTAAILAASAALQPDASPASIALLLAQQGVAVDTAYIRTVLSRSKPKDADEVGQGGGGYA